MQRQEGVVVQAIMGCEMTSLVLGLLPSVRCRLAHRSWKWKRKWKWDEMGDRQQIVHDITSF